MDNHRFGLDITKDAEEIIKEGKIEEWINTTHQVYEFIKENESKFPLEERIGTKRMEEYWMKLAEEIKKR